VIDDSFIIWRTPPEFHIHVRERCNEAEREGKSLQPWTQYLKDHPDAWNGPLLQLVEADENQLVARAGDYRTYIESRQSPLTRENAFLAVTGVLFNGSGFLVGLRSKKVRRPGTWEFAPAGGLESFPIEQQLNREIVEELNIDPSDLKVGQPVGMYLDREEGIADVVVPVRVLASWSDIQGGFEPGEYERLEVMSPSSLARISHDDGAVDDLFRCIVGLIHDGIIDTAA